jgi:hypothetical protein
MNAEKAGGDDERKDTEANVCVRVRRGDAGRKREVGRKRERESCKGKKEKKERERKSEVPNHRTSWREGALHLRRNAYQVIDVGVQAVCETHPCTSQCVCV